MDLKQRLFLALWPDEKTRQNLYVAYQSTLAGSFEEAERPLGPASYHLTLHYLGQTGPDQKACYIEQAKRLSFTPFSMQIDTVGQFSRAAVSWLAPGKIPGELLQLHDDLRRNLADCGFKAEYRPFKPHITMARKFKLPIQEQKITPLCWDVDRFVLVLSAPSTQGVRYRVIETFPAC